MKPKSSVRRTLWGLAGILFLGIYLTHFRYLVLLTNDAHADTNGISIAKTKGLVKLEKSKSQKIKQTPHLSKAIPAQSLFQEKAQIENEQTSTTLTIQEPPFVEDIFCGGCRPLVVARARGLTCGTELNKTAKTKNTSLAQAADIVVQAEALKADIERKAAAIKDWELGRDYALGDQTRRCGTVFEFLQRFATLHRM